MAIRLIDTKTLSMSSFVGSSVPDYAILSHTWGADSEEITFQDMIALNRGFEHPKNASSGYCKVIETCQKARAAGIGYCWVDTCCIDKTSSSELSEAINSMYNWYHDAAICYVLLSDFDVGSLVDEETLGDCRWFTRGWCLQELVAPRCVIFYDRLWNAIGTKESLAPSISTITMIKTKVLTGRVPIESLPIAQRLSWAANRETTRKEDIAYCLLGICDIHMPILYGEGSRAFIRLQEEIIKRSNDLSIFAARQPDTSEEPDPLQRFRDLLAPSPKHFTHCADVYYASNDTYQSSAYAMTNRGLHFPEAYVHCDYDHGVYRIDLNYNADEERSVGQLVFQQVGPNLFARCHDQLLVKGVDVPFVLNILKDIYVISNIRPSLQAHLSIAGKYAIKVPSRWLQDPGKQVLEVLERPLFRGRWDIAGMRFLTKGLHYFEATMKFRPRRALKALDETKYYSQIKNTSCYLILGVRSPVSGSAPSPWVHLVDETTWQLLQDHDDKKSTFSLAAMLNITTWGTQATRARLHLGARKKNHVYLDASITVDAQQRRINLELDLNFEGEQCCSHREKVKIRSWKRMWRYS
ncbi:hypothetical protein SLS60_006036 [Paraconiothyrium brasiliense]|uniref:Heterokaryon incompatibility domain-containing protein n=1 Tax=Paraconiothyrium brasiliense TaxID=300254 RepID=A0ABR3RDV2_9PLEO